MAITVMHFVDGHEEAEVMYEGAVLCTRERNGYDDSDFYAICFDVESYSFREVEYATTRAYTEGNHAEADATDEVKEKAAKKYADIMTDAWVRNAIAEARKVESGKTVRVTRTIRKRTGRHIQNGEVGVVKRVMVDSHRSYRYLLTKPQVALVQFDDGFTAWVSEYDLVAEDCADYLPSLSEVENKRLFFQRNPYWANLTVAPGFVTL